MTLVQRLGFTFAQLRRFRTSLCFPDLHGSCARCFRLTQRRLSERLSATRICARWCFEPPELESQRSKSWWELIWPRSLRSKLGTVEMWGRSTSVWSERGERLGRARQCLETNLIRTCSPRKEGH